MIKECVKELKVMMGLEGKVIKKELPDWMSRGNRPAHNDLNFEYAVAVLKTPEHIEWFEKKNGITIPEEYKKDIYRQYPAGI